MPQQTITLTGTRPFIARRLRLIFLSRFSAAAYVALLLFLSWQLQRAHDVRFPLLCILILFLFIHVISTYLQEILENDALPLPENAPIVDYLSSELTHALRKTSSVTSSDLLDASLRTTRGRFILEEMNITASHMRERCAKDIDDSIELLSFLDFAKSKLAALGETRIDANVVLWLCFLYVQSCKKVQEEADLSDEELLGIMHWESFHHRFRVRENPWDATTIMRNSSMGRSWVMGYTDMLDQLTVEVPCEARVAGERSVVIHTDAIDAVLRSLTRSKGHNTLILGKVGVGKRSLVENTACALRAFEQQRHLSFTRALTLQTETLLSGVGNPDTFLLHALSRAQQSGRFVLVIRDLALLLRSANGNLKAVLLKCLQAQSIAIIGIADTQDYHALIKTDPLLDNLFEKIVVEDPSDEETMQVLMAHYFALEARNVRITYKALKSILDLTKRYLSTRKGLPGIAIDVMDDSVLRAREQADAFVREDHVRSIISLKSRVNVERMGQGEKERLLNLEETLKRKVIGQENAIRAVVSSLKRARMDLHDRRKPVGTFLFLGPTGVGKTQTAKALAEEYFGSSDAMIRLDMNEYSQPNSVFNIIGDAGSGEGFLAQRVQDKPFSLVLLDEIEKAHPAVLNLFLQILDEGFLNDSRGMRTDFRNTIIIATSNAGALFIRDFLKSHADIDKSQFKQALIETVLHEKQFAPEFINRFDEVVLFHPLSPEVTSQVASLMITEIVSDVQKRRGIAVKFGDDVIATVVERGYSVDFGAREMRRTITELIEDYLADYLLKHEVKRGEEIVIHKDDLRS